MEGRDLTKGSVSKKLILFSLPLIGAYLLQSLYSTVDMLIVSYLAGTYSMSAVNIVGQISQVVTGIAFGFLSGATVMIAQYLGGGRHQEKQEAIETTFSFVFWLSVITTVVMLCLADPLLTLLNTPKECYQEAWNYYMIYMAGTIFVFFYNAISSILRGMGDSRNPLYFVILSTVVNIILDLIMVGPMKMGAAGAALATIISQAVSVLVSVLYLKKIGFSFLANDRKAQAFPENRENAATEENVFSKNLAKKEKKNPSFSEDAANKRGKRRFWKINREQLKILFQLGTPAAIQETLLNVSLVVLIAVANNLGVYESAAVGIGAKINVIFILPVCALNVALATMVGQNVGAGKMERAMKAAKLELIYSAIYSAVICAVMWVFSKELLMIFTRDPQTLTVGADYFKGHCWDYLLLMPFGYCFGGLFMGTGHSGYVAIANGVGALISRIPLSIVLAQVMGLGVVGIGLAYPISTFFTDLTYFILFLKGDWKQSGISREGL